MDVLHTGFEDLGLTLYGEFLTAAEEEALIAKINNIEARRVATSKFRTSVSRFGSSRPYSSFVQSKVIPDYLLAYTQRLVELGLVTQQPDSVSINEYDAGHTIAPHIDSRASGDVITVLSLDSSAVMRFTRPKHEPICVTLPQRSLVQMRGELRLIWEHEILPVPAHRYSIVFRCSTLH